MVLPVFSGRDGEEMEYYTRQKLQRVVQKKVFLLECLAERVVPKTVSTHFKCSSNPFPFSAYSLLKEQVEQCTFEAESLKAKLPGVHLPHHLITNLRAEHEMQVLSNRRKLQAAIDSSGWAGVVRDGIVTNLSHRQLSPVEHQALSLGLKLDVGGCRQDLMDVIYGNYRATSSPLERGFAQGIAIGAFAAAKVHPSTIPRRFTRALVELGKDATIAIVPADKGGGLVLLDRVDYVSKMMDLLNDPVTYKRVCVGSWQKKSDEFNSAARKIMNKSLSGSMLKYLLVSNPRCPFARATIKTHKPELNARPIINGRDAVPHRLARKLAKTLTQAVGMISGKSLKNSADLMARLQNITIRCKQLVSFDVKSLFTNISVAQAMAAAKRALDLLDDDVIPLPKDDFLSLVEMCVRFGSFSFESMEFEQVDGLAMGSPLSAVLATLALECLERDCYLPLIGQNGFWVRYVDDVLAILPLRTNVDNLLQEVERSEPSGPVHSGA